MWLAKRTRTEATRTETEEQCPSWTQSLTPPAAASQPFVPLPELERVAADRPSLPADFAQALRRPAIALIAEVKRRSPVGGCDQ